MAIFKAVKDRVVVGRALDERLHAMALEEMQSGKRRTGLWAKALLQAGTDQRQTELAYLRLLVQQLKDEIYIQERVNDLAAAEAGAQVDAQRDAEAHAALLAAALTVCATLRVEDVDLRSYQVLAQAIGASLEHQGIFSAWCYTSATHRQVTFHSYSELRPWFLANVVTRIEAEA